MNIIKTSLFSAVSTVVKMFSGFVINKMVAIYAGPGGIALVGQLQNFVNIILLSSGSFLKTAITKFTAEYLNDETNLSYKLSAAIRINFTLCIITCLIIYFFSDYISTVILLDIKYSYIFKVFSISLPFYVLNMVFLSIINGKRKVEYYNLINIFQSLFNLIVTSILTYYYEIDGALIAIVINQSIVFIIALIIYNKFIDYHIFLSKIRKSDVVILFKYGVTAIVSVLLSNISLMFIRDYLSSNLGEINAGYWQGLININQIIISLITISLSTYVLPILSSAKKKIIVRLELKKITLFITFFTIFSCSIIFLLRDFIILLLYSKEFILISDIILWQLIGTVFATIAWPFGYLLVIKGYFKIAIINELLSALLLVLLTVFLVNKYGLIGTTYSYLITNLIYLGVVIIQFFYILRDFK
ncbi:O-antigen translocase [Photobacterium damselae subsp. damselae]|uniref:O-antigen translocase n=1 Tax=Photobacterium damselae TaxID=38293 RepID=UPI00083AA580|nr:O-antigen translocase [Photobacterium damselae]QSH58003.1 O-antigen translocase [Photobacterium damselae subsp. damselae]